MYYTKSILSPQRQEIYHILQTAGCKFVLQARLHLPINVGVDGRGSLVHQSVLFARFFWHANILPQSQCFTRQEQGYCKNTWLTCIYTLHHVLTSPSQSDLKLHNQIQSDK